MVLTQHIRDRLRQEGREEEQRRRAEWNKPGLEAEAEGREFDEPPPDAHNAHKK